MFVLSFQVCLQPVSKKIAMLNKIAISCVFNIVLNVSDLGLLSHVLRQIAEILQRIGCHSFR
jgi:hypothetical protein